MDELQRGDVVDVKFESGFTYRGVVLSVSKRKVYIITRSSGHVYKPGDAEITVIEQHPNSTEDQAHVRAQSYV